MCRDHRQHFNFFRDINWIHEEKYHPCPRWFVLSSTTLLPFVQHKIVRVLCYTLSSLLSSNCSSLPWSITIFYVKNVMRITPPLKNSWYSDTSRHLRSFLGTHVVSNWKTDNWTMMCKFKTSSNPIALTLMVDSFILSLLLTNHHSNFDRAT